LYLSPYPKLPIFGCHCPAVHIVHDVLDLTHEAYRKRTKAVFDKTRLRRALKRASLTWYDSEWSLNETRKLVGDVGRNPKVRYPAVGAGFHATPSGSDEDCREKYSISSRYILSIGNGLPHKNLGILLSIADRLSRELVFIGVREKNMRYWQDRFDTRKARWIEFAADEDLPAILRGAFCIAHPSTAEGYGYPPLEAMASGIPAVVSDIPVLRETTGGRSVLARPDDPGHWLESFASLENRDHYRRLVDDGLEWVRPFQGDAAWTSHIGDIRTLLGEKTE
jgi:glycosyltransferase involved in cell wall biosynthesis